MTDTVLLDPELTSFGTFKPVGQVMVGLPGGAQALGLAMALRQAGWPASGYQHIAPRESVDELQALIDNASAWAGLGYEITMMRRYLALARDGVRWVLAKVDSTEQAAEVAELARQHGALLAVHYRMLTVEELL